MSTDEVPQERVIARLRPHGRALFWPCVLLIAVCGATGFFAGRFSVDWQNSAVLIAAAVLVVLLWLLPLLAWLSRNYTITTRRIIIRRGLVVRTRQELMHTRGYDLTVRKNGVQSLFGSGDVLINTGLDRPIVLWDVPSADLVQSTLHDLMEVNISAVARLRQQEQSTPPQNSTYWNGV
ncbi:PH domain-containing protein [Frondihabitans cladoniiphilus]|uniref:YdbS-like PH domain-containing protein n=1 Tax=Frondihabitans cladoniiphilus TaxID=715785 RepID=A0ABP8WEB6_9MICO